MLSVQSPGWGGGEGVGGDYHLKRGGMLVRNFKLNP